MEYYQKLINKYNKLEEKNFENIKSVTNVIKLSDLKNNQIQKVANIKLNGGLGTTMDCTFDYPKGLIKINDKCFLDYAISPNLILMNSFFTYQKTLEYLKEHKLNVLTFNQTAFPRLLNGKLIDDINNQPKPDLWYPPGHGDIFISMYNEKILDKLEKDNIEYIFISNIDNIGANIDYRIINKMMEDNLDVVVEVVEKKENDIKGGVLITDNNKIQIFELNKDNIKYLSDFKYFNTNNIWFKVSSIKKLLEIDFIEQLDIIVNPKKLNNNEVIQLEYSLGSLLKFFDKVCAIEVNRDRFIPVKTLDDLEKLRKNLIKKNDK